MDRAYDITIDSGVVALGHGRDVVDGLKPTNKRFMYMLMENMKLVGSKIYDDQMSIHTTKHKEDLSLEKYLKNFNITKNGIIDQGKYKNVQVNGHGMSVSIMFKIIMILTTQLSKLVAIQLIFIH